MLRAASEGAISLSREARSSEYSFNINAP
jgi:hypothetical protein